VKFILTLIAGALLHRYRKEIMNAIEDKVLDGIEFVKGEEYVDDVLENGPDRIDKKVDGFFKKLDEFAANQRKKQKQA
jgi:hypothetical protein